MKPAPGIAVRGGGARKIKTRFSRRLFYWYCRKVMHVDVPTNSTYFIALSRRAVQAATTVGKGSVHVRQAVATIGYSYTVFPYETLQDPIRSRRLNVGFLEAIDIIISSYSVHPLRFMSWLGFIASIVSIVYALYVIIIAMTRQHVARMDDNVAPNIWALFHPFSHYDCVVRIYRQTCHGGTQRHAVSCAG